MSTASLTRKKLIKWASVVVLTVAAAYFVLAFSSHWRDIPSIQLGYEAFLALSISSLGMAINYWLGAFIWRKQLLDYNQNISLTDVFNIVSISQIGKYIPGNIGHLVGQITLAKAEGITISVAGITMTLFNLWLVAVACILGTVGIIFYFNTGEPATQTIPNIYLLLGLAVSCIFLPPLAITLTNHLLPTFAKRIGNGQSLPSQTPITTLWTVSGFMITFLIFGIMVKLQAIYLFQNNNGSILAFATLFALAWVSGYLLPGAPGGLGVRESLLTILLSPIIGLGAALGISVTMRITTMSGDFLAFLVGFYLKKYGKAK